MLDLLPKTIITMTRLLTSLFVAASFIVACSQNPLTKKSQLTLLPESELQNMGSQQYQQFLSQNKVVSASSNRDAEMVRRVGQRIVKAVEIGRASCRERV